MGRPSPAQLAAEREVTIIRDALKACGMRWPTVTSERQFTSTPGMPRLETWRAGALSGVAVDLGLQGTWTVRVVTRFQNLLEDQAGIADSSISLNVDGSVISGCLVRFDTEYWGKERGLHFHVHQPSPLEDRVHWSIPGYQRRSWDYEEVLSYLLSAALVEELRAAGVPAT